MEAREDYFKMFRNFIDFLLNSVQNMNIFISGATMHNIFATIVGISLLFINNAALASPEPGLLAQLQIKYDQQQEQIRQMHGQIEQLNYQIQQLQKQSDRAAIDQGAVKPVTPRQSTQHRSFGNAVSPASQQPTQRMILGDGPQQGPSNGMMLGTSSGSNSQIAYEEARRLLDQRRFAEAEVAFTQFIHTYPNDPLLVNAYYWVGETHYIRGDYTQAALKFGEAYQAYQQHKNSAYREQGNNKAPEIILKLGMSLANIGKYQEAKVALAELEKEFPRIPGNLQHQVSLLKLELDRRTA